MIRGVMIRKRVEWQLSVTVTVAPNVPTNNCAGWKILRNSRGGEGYVGDGKHLSNSDDIERLRECQSVDTQHCDLNRKKGVQVVPRIEGLLLHNLIPISKAESTTSTVHQRVVDSLTLALIERVPTTLPSWHRRAARQ